MYKITANTAIDLYANAGAVFSKEFIKDIMDNFSIDNPAIEVRKRLGKKTWGLPKKLIFYKSMFKDHLQFNLGDLKLLISIMQKHNMPYILVHDNKFNYAEYSFTSALKLRDYQSEAVEASKDSYIGGCIVIPAGGGKTITGMKIIADHNVKTLWITHTKDLMYQSAEACKKCLGIEPGILGDGKQKDLDSNVVIATVQTLSLRENLIQKFNEERGLIIIDEAHHVPTSYFTSILQNLRGKKIGLTATPIRKDSLERQMYSIIGPIEFEVARERLYDDAKLIIPELVQVYTKFIGDTINLDEVSANIGGDDFCWHKLVDALINDEERLSTVINTILSNVAGHKSVVLTEWVSYGNKLLEELRTKLPNLRIEFASGSTKRDDRELFLNDFREGKIDILIATKIAREGLDLPNMTQLFLTTPKHGDVGNEANGAALEQEVGRVMRPDPNNVNKNARVFDFIDYDNAILRGQWYSRRKTYKRLGIKITNKPREKFEDTNYVKNALFPDL